MRPWGKRNTSGTRDCPLTTSRRRIPAEQTSAGSDTPSRGSAGGSLFVARDRTLPTSTIFAVAANQSLIHASSQYGGRACTLGSLACQRATPL